jgi:hypothetical protein
VTFDHDLTDAAEILAGITLISDQVGTRLRRKKLFASVVQIQIKDTSLKVINRQKQLAQYTCNTRLIRDTAVRLLRENWPEGMPIRMLSVGVTGLSLTVPNSSTSLWIRQRRKKRSVWTKPWTASGQSMENSPSPLDGPWIHKKEGRLLTVLPFC